MNTPTIVGGSGPKTLPYPHFYFVGGKLVPCENVGTRAVLSDGTTLEAQQWGDEASCIITYIVDPGQGKRRPRGWAKAIEAKLDAIRLRPEGA